MAAILKWPLRTNRGCCNWSALAIIGPIAGGSVMAAVLGPGGPFVAATGGPGPTAAAVIIPRTGFCCDILDSATKYNPYLH